MIYLDNAASSFPKPPEVAEAMLKALNGMGNSDRSTHSLSLAASRLIYDTRELLSDLFNVGSPAHVAFTANSTESLNMAIQGGLKPGDHVITTSLEHNSVLRPLYLMRERGLSLSIVSADTKGCINYADLEANIQQNTKMIVCTHASNVTGNALNIEQIGALCQKRGLLFVVDASQTAGLFAIDMQKMNIGILCVTGHKSLLGPTGTGALCINPRQNIQLSPLKVGGSGVQSYSEIHPREMPTHLEAGTQNGVGIAGLHASLLYIKQKSIAHLYQQELELAKMLHKGFSAIKNVRIYGNFDSWERAAIVTINIGNMDAGQVADILATEYDIAVRAGAHCAPLMHEALGTREQGAVRFSPSHFTSKADIKSAIGAVAEIAHREDNA